MQILRTVSEVREFLKNYPDESQIMVDINTLNGGSFENLKVSLACESPLDNPRCVEFVLTKHGE